jgi:signal transduction histidine kinase
MEQILTTFHDDEEDGEKKHMIAICMNECRRLRELIRSMQSFGRPTSSQRRPVDLNRIITDVLDLCAKNFEKKNIHLEKNLQAIPLLNAVEDQLKQVVFNLVTNAADAIEKKGGRIFVSTAQAKDVVVFSVTDSGCGIAPEDVQAVFAPFFTTKQEGMGTGLGLSICYGIVTNHKGTIEVKSSPGEGATFTVRLPLLEGKP